VPVAAGPVRTRGSATGADGTLRALSDPIDRGPPGPAPPGLRSAPTGGPHPAKRSLNSTFRTFPLTVIGNASTISTLRGTL
jgi:hypothetical protein